MAFRRKRKKNRHGNITAISRRSKTFLVLLFLAVGIPSLIYFDRLWAGRLGIIAGPQTKISDTEKYHGRFFTVVNIVDGDTLDINIGDGKYDRTRIRLLGIDTPETGGKAVAMYYGPEAKKAVKELVMGRQVRVIIDDAANIRDKYGRLLAYLQMEDGRQINAELVAGGFAYADLRFPHSNFQKYVELQEQARQGKKGLWQGVKKEDMPEWLRRMRPDLTTAE